jgi:hypothetical protein
MVLCIFYDVQVVYFIVDADPWTRENIDGRSKEGNRRRKDKGNIRVPRC